MSGGHASLNISAWILLGLSTAAAVFVTVGYWIQERWRDDNEYDD